MKTQEMIPPSLQKLYPFEGNFRLANGGKQHYLDINSKADECIVAVHGNPTWSFYWRALTCFSDRYRIVIPDHIGCGLSDKPQDWTYQLADHVQNLCDLLLSLDLTKIHLVVHDWGGAIGMGFATRYPEKIASLTITNTAAFRSQEIPLSIASCRIPIFGSLAVRGGNAFAGVATWRATAKGLSKEVKDGLIFPYDNWKNRIATLRFVEDIPLKESHPSYQTLLHIEENLHQLKQHPMQILWGEQDFCFTPNFRRRWQEFFPDAEVQAWEDVGHYVMEDAPERVIEQMQKFFQDHCK